MLWAHVWGIGFLGEHERWTGIVGSVLLAAGVVTVSSSKAKASEIGPDDTTAFVTSIESKAPDFEDTRITLGNGADSDEDEWQEPRSKASDDVEIEMGYETKSKSQTNNEP